MTVPVLYPKQVEVKDGIRREFHLWKNVLLQASTGFGKTIVGCSSIADAYAKGKTVWFIVPRRELAKQTANTLERWGLTYSYILAGYPYNPYARIHIVSQQTIVNRLDKVHAPDLAMFDEAHIGGQQVDTLMHWLKAAGSFVLGLTATPIRTDGQGLGKWYDTMVCGPSTRWLIDNKYLSNYRAYAPSMPDLRRIKKTAGDYNKGEIASFMEGQAVLIGDAVRHYRQTAMGRLNLIFTTSRKHSEITTAKFNEAGIPARHIDCETPEAERKQIIRAFAMRQLLALSTVSIADVGFDLSANAGMDVTVESMSDLSPTMSLARQLQKNGRILRKKDYHAVLLDHAGNIHRHGLPCADRIWSLADRDIQGKGGQSPDLLPVKRCDVCFFSHPPAPACPECGRIYPVEGRKVDYRDGELEEIVSAPPVKTEKELQSQLHGLIGIAKQRGYSDLEKWAAQKVTEMMQKRGGR